MAPGTKPNKPKQNGRPLRGSTFRPTNETTSTTPAPPSTNGNKTPRKPQAPSTTNSQPAAQQKKPFANAPTAATSGKINPPGLDIAGAIAAAVAAVNEEKPSPVKTASTSRPASPKKPSTAPSVTASAKTPRANEATKPSTAEISRSEKTKILQGVVESVVKDALTEAISHCTLTPSATAAVTHSQFLAKLVATEDSLDESNYYDGLFGDSEKNSNKGKGPAVLSPTAKATSNSDKIVAPSSTSVNRPKSAGRSIKSNDDKAPLTEAKADGSIVQEAPQDVEYDFDYQDATKDDNLNTSTVSTGGNVDDLYENIRSNTPTKVKVTGNATPSSSKRGTRPQSAAKKTRSEDDYANEDFYEDDGGFEPI
jgi:hypothetical protein